VTAAEMAQLAELVARLEQAVHSAFDYQAINYLMLMMVDHQVHFHVIPRYDSRRLFAGLQWLDEGWPTLPPMTALQHGDHPGILALIRQELASAAVD